MKQLFLVIGFLSTVACGSNFKSVNFSAAKSEGTQPGVDDPNVPENTTPIMDASGAALVGQDLVPVLLNMFEAIQNTTTINFAQPTQTISANSSAACPLGGTITASASATLNLTVSGLSANGSVNNGTGQLTFSSCMIAPGVALNGSASVMAFNASLVAALSLSDNNTYSVNGSHQLVGNLTVSYNGRSESCALALSDTLSSSGTFHIVSATSSGTVNAALSGTVCNFAVNQTLTQTF